MQWNIWFPSKAAKINERILSQYSATCSQKDYLFQRKSAISLMKKIIGNYPLY